ncbi:MAG: amidohydrolase family protein [Thermoplasmata archaeon]|nr:amidohydrolase family protein [Thermoplasmata archaeon]
MIVEGAILDIDGPRAGYVRFRDGRVIEVGKLGTDSTRGRERRIRGIVIPSPVNSHTHLGDAISVREPPPGPVSSLVRPPDGYKFRLLAAASPGAKRRALRGAFERMSHDGVAAVIDFREEGLDGVRLFQEAARGSTVRAVVMGRPLQRPVVRRELDALLSAADGVGLSSALEENIETRTLVARACRARGKRYGLHASEARREPPDSYLHPHPDLLIHLAKATRDDLETVRDAKVAVAVCPRSNALFGRQPDLRSMERLGIPVLLGTDNAMFHAPSIWRELEFAYVATRLRQRPASAEFLARAVLVEPWRWLGDPRAARVAAGMTVPPLVVRLPPDDPAYQVVTRTTEHLILRVAPRSPVRVHR